MGFCGDNTAIFIVPGARPQVCGGPWIATRGSGVGDDSPWPCRKTSNGQPPAGGVPAGTNMRWGMVLWEATCLPGVTSPSDGSHHKVSQPSDAIAVAMIITSTPRMGCPL